MNTVKMAKVLNRYQRGKISPNLVTLCFYVFPHDSGDLFLFLFSSLKWNLIPLGIIVITLKYVYILL